MADFRTILVPLDGSSLAEQVIPYASRLAGGRGALVFAHVVPEPEELHGLFGGTIATQADMLTMERETAGVMLRDTSERWNDVVDAEPLYEIATGTAADGILELAESTRADMIAIASHGRGALGRLAFGSVADRIARSSTHPVMIMHPQSEEPPSRARAEIRRIVMPLDGSDISERAIPIGIELATAIGVPIHVVQATNPATLVIPSPMGAAAYPTEMYQELEDDMVDAANQTLSRAQGRIEQAGVSASRAIVDGPAVAAIESEVRDGDVIVMTSHGNSGFRRWLLGSVAEKLIQSGAAPVVLVPATERGGEAGQPDSP